jgi:hypothetical protein
MMDELILLKFRLNLQKSLNNLRNYVYLDVAYISHIYYKCFIWMLRMFAMIPCVFVSVLDICFVFKCFICLQICCKCCV